MTTYNTGNPLGSTDPRDLYDNAENFDEAVNSEESQWVDRFGRPRLPLMEQERQFVSDQERREGVFSGFLQGSGYQDLGEYAPGIEITAHNQYVTFGGQPYLLKPSVPVPYTTSGEWTGDDFKLIGDDSLRQDLANPDKGAAMVARGVVAVDSVDDLMALPERRNDLRYLVAGSPFKWDSATSTFVPEGIVNAKVFGFSPDATPSANSDAIESALAFCAGRARLYVEPVEHTISRTIEIPSNTYLFSDGKEHIVFRMDTGVRRGEMVMVTGHRGVHKENIVLRGFGIDANRGRWDIADNNSVYREMTPTGEWYERNMSAMSQSALVICNSSNVLVEDLKIIDPYSHCIDVTAPADGRYQNSAVLYDPEPSHDVVVRDIVVAGHGDDGVTTHQSHDVLIDNIVSLGASGVKVQINANAVEIDDGSRHIRVGTVVGRECTHALSIQGHADSPAPYSITVGTVVAINCRMGVTLTHTGWGSSSDPEGISGGAGDGLSPTARGVSIGNIICIAPRRTEFYGTVMEARGALGLTAYENVTIGSVHCVEGNSHLADGIDGILPATPTDAGASRLIATYNGNARGITIGSIHIEGFSTTEHGVFLAPRHGGITVGSLVVRNGPKNAFTDGSTSIHGGRVRLISYDVQGNHVGQGTTAIVHTGRAGSEIGHGSVEGYDVAVAGPVGSGSGSPYAIVDGSSDVRVAASGGVVRRLWIGNSVRASEWLTGATHNFGSAGGIFAFYNTEGGDTDTSSGLMVINATSVRPGVNNALSSGSPSFRWSEVFSANGTINTSDEREKTLQRGLSVVEQAVARELKGIIKAFKWKDAISIKGEEGARWHFGVMAQEVKGVFERHGLDAHDYGMFCYDEWGSVPAVLGENGEIVEPAVDHGNRYGVRYDQLLAFIIAAL